MSILHAQFCAAYLRRTIKGFKEAQKKNFYNDYSYEINYKKALECEKLKARLAFVEYKLAQLQK